jgi:transcriptional regulator with XRE-family HTH domain
MTKVDTAWFKSVLAERGISQRKFAGRLGIDPASLSYAIHGKRKVSAAEAVRIADELGVSRDDVDRALGLSARKHRAAVDVVGVVDHRGIIHMDPKSPIDRVTVPLDTPTGAYGLLARSSGSALAYMDGALLVVGTETTPAECIGRLAVVDADDKTRLAYVRRGLRRERYSLLLPATGEAEESVDITSVSPVLWIRP